MKDLKTILIVCQELLDKGYDEAVHEVLRKSFPRDTSDEALYALDKLTTDYSMRKQNWKEIMQEYEVTKTQ